MFDFQGTYTETQLRELEAWLQAQIQALPAIIEQLEYDAARLVGRTTMDDVGASERSFPVTHEQGDVVYSLMTEEIPVGFSGESYLEFLRRQGIRSRYSYRVDPLSGDVTISDSPWRDYGRLPIVNSYLTNPLEFVDDDVVPAVWTQRITDPMRSQQERQEDLEEKAKKAKYEYELIRDDIAQKRRLLVSFQDDLAMVEELLANQITLTNTAGEEETVSEYPTAGVERKTDVTNPEDVERLSYLFLPGATGSGASAEDADQPGLQIIPEVPGTVEPIELPPDAQPGSMEEFARVWPLAAVAKTDPKSTIPDYKLQVLANIWEYARDVYIELPSGIDYLYRSDAAPEYILFLPNVLEDLHTWALYVYQTYGFVTHITEAWPPTVNHMNIGGHFTGNSVDLVMWNPDNGIWLTRSETRVWRDMVSIDFVDKILRTGEDLGLFNAALNEYRIRTEYSTGPHIHLGWVGSKIKYMNDARLLSLGLTSSQQRQFRIT